MSAHARNIGGFVKLVNGGGYATATAGGAGDATEVNGASIDRQALANTHQSVVVAIPAVATLASGATLTIAANLQDSDNDSDWTDFGDALAATVVATGPSGGGVRRGVAKLSQNISGARRYLRVQVTPNLSAAGTDTAIQSEATFVFGGGEELPES